MSLLKISQELNNKKIKYMDDIVGWNKSRIKKIIDDERYLGNEIYSRIIDKETYDKLQIIKQCKNTQKTIDKTSAIFEIDASVLCGNCGFEMKRYSDNRRSIKDKWICKNENCKTNVGILNAEFIQKVTNILNRIIDSPQVIDTANKNNNIDENTITNKDEAYLPKEEMQKKIVSSISERYSKIDTLHYISRRIKYEFEKAEKTKEFQLELFNNTVKSIKLYENKNVGLTLVNNQYVDMG